MPAVETQNSRLHGKLLYAASALCVAIIAFATYFQNYQYPPKVAFDEAYHLTNAQRYLNGVFYMHSHPPLGKLFIALGESLVGANERNDQFIGTTKINEDLPERFSFAGYRLFPALFAWGSALLIFFSMHLITGSLLMSLLLSTGYLFENALIMHSRLALLEPSQIFFVLLTIFIFLLLYRESISRRFVIYSLAFGAAFGAVLNIKLNGAILALLLPALFVKWSFNLRRSGTFIICSLVTALAVTAVVWQIHFALGKRVVDTLDHDGYFRASEEYKQIIAEGAQWSLSSFPIMIRDSYAYFSNYHGGVPTLNLCKDDEIGSPTFTWPVGGRSINYRWEKIDKDSARYLYLQSNPVIWLTGLAAVLISFILLGARLVFPNHISLKNPLLLSSFLGMYIAYLGVMSWLERVTYLYHYLLPLLFSLFLLALVIKEIGQIGAFTLTNRKKILFLVIWAVASLAAFTSYSPLTYYRPITNDGLKKLAIFSIWDLRCPDCPDTSRIADPSAIERAKEREFDHIKLDGLSTYRGYLERNHPSIKMNQTAEGKDMVINGVHYTKGIGAHANSFLKFNLKRKYDRFKALAGLPDYLDKDKGSVIFQVLGDGKLLWESDIVRPHQPPREIDLDVAGVKILELKVDEAGDDPHYDHACWLKPELD